MPLKLSGLNVLSTCCEKQVSIRATAAKAIYSTVIGMVPEKVKPLYSSVVLPSNRRFHVGHEFIPQIRTPRSFVLNKPSISLLCCVNETGWYCIRPVPAPLPSAFVACDGGNDVVDSLIESIVVSVLFGKTLTLLIWLLSIPVGVSISVFMRMLLSMAMWFELFDDVNRGNCCMRMQSDCMAAHEMIMAAISAPISVPMSWLA